MIASQLVLLSALAAGTAPQGVLYEFTATWCGPCKQIAPTIARLEHQGYPIKSIDVDRNRALADKYNIRFVPTFVLVANGREVRRVVGAEGMTEASLKRLMAQIPHPQEKPRREQPQARPPASSKPRTKPRFSIPFLGSRKRKPEPRDTSHAVVRGNIGRGASASQHSRLGEPLDVSTRIRIQDSGGVNYGSGTIVSSQIGRTLVLTCGHIFRGLNNSSTIEVDVYTRGRPQTFVGKLLKSDETSDVGLIEIPTDTLFPHAQVAPVGFAVGKGDPVITVGCGRGADPTVQRQRVTALNRYLGPDNVECTGVPVQGRSGGGLFSNDGLVIGVCSAADPQDQRGLYTGLTPVHKLLSACRLQHLFRDARSGARSPKTDSPAESLTKFDGETFDDLENQADDRELATSKAALTATVAEAAASTAQSQAIGSALELLGEAEVVCVVRPIGSPQAASKVIILNRASGRFIKYLTEELGDQATRTMTSLKVRKPKPASQRAKQPLRTANKPASAIPRTVAKAPTDKRTGSNRGPRRYRRTRR